MGLNALYLDAFLTGGILLAAAFFAGLALGWFARGRGQ